MTRIKKLVAAASVAAALVGAPTVAYAVSSGGASASLAQVSAAETVKAAKASSAKVVAPGEHVKAHPAVDLWLTKDGKYWSTPDNKNQFRSVIDGNLDLSVPGVSLQAEPVSGDYFLSGVYYGVGKADAVRVEVDTTAGQVAGKVVELAGKPGWGAW